MANIDVRRFNRGDREQVTALANAHIGAVIPGVSVSVQGLMSQLEREPDEYIVDPWVDQRFTLVAEQRKRVVAAAHLLRYGLGDPVGKDYRNAGEIRWLLCWPHVVEAGDALAMACLAQLQALGVSRYWADGRLPVPGVYGVPAQWPHIREIYERIGFRHGGSIEVIFMARVPELARPPAPLPGLTGVREVGDHGTKISAVIDTHRLGYIEIDTNLDAATRMSRLNGLADVGDLHVEPAHRRRGIGRWLLGEAAAWLELGGASRLLDYADAEEDDYAAFLRSVGFSELTRTLRGLER